MSDSQDKVVPKKQEQITVRVTDVMKKQIDEHLSVMERPSDWIRKAIANELKGLHLTQQENQTKSTETTITLVQDQRVNDLFELLKKTISIVRDAYSSGHVELSQTEAASLKTIYTEAKSIKDSTESTTQTTSNETHNHQEVKATC